MAAAAKAARRNTTVHIDFYLPNDPFQDPCIGRRTGVPLNIDARKDSFGFDNIDDYFPDSDPEEENIVPNAQSSDKDFVGRRTGKILSINPRKDSKGFDNVDDYFPESGGDKSKELSSEEGQPGNTETDDRPAEVGLSKETNSEGTFDNTEEQETAATPTITRESPNETGTVIKNAASSEPTPEVRGPVSKRLSFSHGESQSESEPKEPKSARRRLHDVNCTAVKNGKTGNSDSENDAVDVEIESPSAVVSNDHPQTAIKLKEKTENSRVTKAKQNQKQQDTSDDDEEVIDVEGIEEDETFLTIGNTTQYLKSTVVDKSPIAAEAESFVMSESFVLEGTKHKTMSPEFGSCSDSQPDVNDAQAPKVKKSRIPVRKKGVSVNIKQRATRGKQKKVQGQENGPHGRKNGGGEVDGGSSNDNENQSKSSRGRKQEAKQNAARGRQKKAEESTIEGHEDNGEVYIDNVEVDNAGEVDEETESFSSRAGRSRVTRGRKNKVESSKVAETEALEVDNEGVAKKGKRRAKSMPGTKVQTQKLSKSSKNDGKSSAVFSDEGLQDKEEQRRGKGRRSVPNIRQQQKEPVKGRKEKTDEKEEVREDKSGDVDADNHEKPAGLKTGKQRKNVAKGSESDEQVELSGRKTRAQRRKEADNKLRGKDGSGEGDEEGGVDDVIEEENEASNNTGYEKVCQEKTRAQRKKTEDALIDRKGENGGKEGVGGGSRLEDVEEKVNMPSEGKRDGKTGASKRKTRASRKRQANTERRDDNQEEEEGNIAESALVPNVEDQGDNGVMEPEDTGQEDELYATGDAMANSSRVMALDTVDELDEDQSSSDKGEEETRSGSTIVSNNVSSSLEFRKKDNSGTGRRRRKPSVLPPYAVKRRANKVNSSKASVSASSPESTTESEQGTYAKKPRLEEVLTEKEAALNSGKRGAKTWVAVNSRKSGGGAQSGGNSKGGNKSVAQKNSTKSSKDGHEKSLQDADENEGYDEGDVDYSVSEDGAVEGRTFEEIPSEDMTPRPLSALGKPATELKSILKSGGPVVRTHAASRKRQMNTDKTHSDGNDADDESALPAKQPNRNRLSTVSFASAPFVAPSPQDPSVSETSKHSPLPGLSFVSKNSSFKSTDRTFTPGSTRTIRSSVGSASGASSTGDSVIDPDEEVTFTNDAEHHKDVSDEQSTRRSKRTIVPPLQYWKNERIDYERRKSGGWCIKKVIRNPTPTPKPRRKTKQTKKRVERKPKSVNVMESSEEELDNEGLEGFEEVTNPKGIVLNPETNEDVDMDIFHVPGMLNFSNPAGKPAQNDDPLLVHKFISQPLFGGGQVILRPGAEKGRQFVRNDTMVFYVIKGRIMVTVHQSSVVLGTGSTFFVPQGNSYNIKNLRQTEAKLTFVQIKG